jgi:hypothetical protein
LLELTKQEPLGDLNRMVNLYNNNSDINSNQRMYDDFNNFIFSKDRNVFNKLYSKISFYEMTKHLCGDIVECGVFKGSGLVSWLKILDMNEPNSIKKVVGFDFFNPNFVDSLEDMTDKETMQQVFTRCNNLDKNDVSKVGVTQKLLLSGFDLSKYDLVEGNIIFTVNEYLKNRPGFRISILNIDLDIEEPTYATLVNLWDRVVDGGVVIFDEYAYHNWSEANAVDRFIKEKGLTLHKTNIKTPTAYIIK